MYNEGGKERKVSARNSNEQLLCWWHRFLSRKLFIAIMNSFFSIFKVLNKEVQVKTLGRYKKIATIVRLSLFATLKISKTFKSRLHYSAVVLWICTYLSTKYKLFRGNCRSQSSWIFFSMYTNMYLGTGGPRIGRKNGRQKTPSYVKPYYSL